MFVVLVMMLMTSTQVQTRSTLYVPTLTLKVELKEQQMLHLPDLRDYVIIPTLKELGMYSPAAVNLLMGTAVQESKLTYLKQIGGPALGIYQMEHETYLDIWRNYLEYKPQIIWHLEEEISEQMVYDLAYATIMARIHYWRRPEPLPDKDDVEGLAKYWKQWWNSPLGKGTVPQFVLNYNRYVKEHAL